MGKFVDEGGGKEVKVLFGDRKSNVFAFGHFQRHVVRSK